MDWSAIGRLIVPLAPTVGSILGGFIPIPGGSLIGQQAGQLLANALGVDPTPEDVIHALANDPNASAKIQAAESEAAAKWTALADIAKAQFSANSQESDSINATMRSELAAGQSWWHWRNLYGYSVAAESTATSWVVLYSLVFAPDLFKNVSNSLPFFLSWYGMRFGLLGYIHNQATQEKVAAATGIPAEGVVKTLVKAYRGK